MKIKNVLLPIMTLVGTIGIASCSANDAIIDETVFTSTNEKIATQAVTSLSMLSSFGSANVSSIKKAREISSEQKEKVEQILPTLDLIFNNGIIFESTVVEENVLINDQNYNYSETISFINESLDNSNIVLYYNIENVEEPEVKLEKSKFGHGDENGHHGDGGEKENEDKENCHHVEETSTIIGVAKLDEDVFYIFISETEIETHNNKTEYERSFKIEINENSYILAKEENEVKKNKAEKEFKYKIVNNGEVTLEYSISLESKNHKEVIEYEIDDTEYEIKKVLKEGEYIYHIEVESDNDSIEYFICYKKVMDEEGNVSFVEIN